MAQVLDYSAGFPGAQAIQNAGYAGAVRYIGFPEKRKCTTAGELADFSAHGLGMALVFESTITDWRGGYGGGQASARRARNHANTIGFPQSRPLYLAVDQDVVSSVEFNVMLDYLRGAGSSLGGPGLTGVYGEADVIDRARDAGVAAWYWQTAAWSRGRRTAAHLYQHVGTAYVGGVGCDINDVLADDWGQHNAEEDDMQLGEFIKDPHTGADVGTVNDLFAEGNKAQWRAVDLGQQALAQLAAIQGALTAGQAATLAAIAGVKPGAPTEEQWAALTSRLGAELGADVAAELGRRLMEGPTT